MLMSSDSLYCRYTYDFFLILCFKSETQYKQPEAMTKNVVKMITLVSIPMFLMTMSCNVVRKADSNTELTAIAPTPVANEQLRTNIIGWAQNYVGTRYSYSGTNPKRGFDCSGFTSYIMREYGVNISHGSTAQATQGGKVSLENAQPGDLVFFGRKKRISHVAIIVSNNNGNITVVHSTNTRGVVVENIQESDYWRKRILFARDVVSNPKNRSKNS
jgi:NlpC/P60 family